MSLDIGKLKQGLKAFMEDDRALVVAFGDIAKLIFFVGLMFVTLGMFLDITYTQIHDAPTGLYTTDDVETVDTIYGFWKFIPILALIAIVIYGLNYSNTRGDD